jgi:ribonuclease PH
VPFSRDELNALMALAEEGINDLTEMQQAVLQS